MNIESCLKCGFYFVLYFSLWLTFVDMDDLVPEVGGGHDEGSGWVSWRRIPSFNCYEELRGCGEIKKISFYNEFEYVSSSCSADENSSMEELGIPVVDVVGSPQTKLGNLPRLIRPVF